LTPCLAVINPRHMNRDLREQLIRTKLGELGFDLKREPSSLDWVVWDRREGKRDLPALPPTRCQDLETVVEFFRLDL
jgi:hypothetical protein